MALINRSSNKVKGLTPSRRDGLSLVAIVIESGFNANGDGISFRVKVLSDTRNLNPKGKIGYSHPNGYLYLKLNEKVPKTEQEIARYKEINPTKTGIVPHNRELRGYTGITNGSGVSVFFYIGADCSPQVKSDLYRLKPGCLIEMNGVTSEYVTLKKTSNESSAALINVSSVRVLTCPCDVTQQMDSLGVVYPPIIRQGFTSPLPSESMCQSSFDKAERGETGGFMTENGVTYTEDPERYRLALWKHSCALSYDRRLMGEHIIWDSHPQENSLPNLFLLKNRFINSVDFNESDVESTSTVSKSEGDSGTDETIDHEGLEKTQQQQQQQQQQSIYDKPKGFIVQGPLYLFGDKDFASVRKVDDTNSSIAAYLREYYDVFYWDKEEGIDFKNGITFRIDMKILGKIAKARPRYMNLLNIYSPSFYRRIAPYHLPYIRRVYHATLNASSTLEHTINNLNEENRESVIHQFALEYNVKEVFTDVKKYVSTYGIPVCPQTAIECCKNYWGSSILRSKTNAQGTEETLSLKRIEDNERFSELKGIRAKVPDTLLEQECCFLPENSNIKISTKKYKDYRLLCNLPIPPTTLKEIVSYYKKLSMQNQDTTGDHDSTHSTHNIVNEDQHHVDQQQDMTKSQKHFRLMMSKWVSIQQDVRALKDDRKREFMKYCASCYQKPNRIRLDSIVVDDDSSGQKKDPLPECRYSPEERWELETFISSIHIPLYWSPFFTSPRYPHHQVEGDKDENQQEENQSMDDDDLDDDGDDDDQILHTDYTDDDAPLTLGVFLVKNGCDESEGNRRVKSQHDIEKSLCPLLQKQQCHQVCGSAIHLIKEPYLSKSLLSSYAIPWDIKLDYRKKEEKCEEEETTYYHPVTKKPLRFATCIGWNPISITKSSSRDTEDVVSGKDIVFPPHVGDKRKKLLPLSNEKESPDDIEGNNSPKRYKLSENDHQSSGTENDAKDLLTDTNDDDDDDEST